MKTRITAIITLLMSLMAAPTYAQVFELRGQVVDTAGKGVAQAYLVFEETGFLVMTDDSGYFELELEQAVHHLLVKKPGYISQKLHFPYHHNEPIRLTLEKVDTTTTFDAERLVRLAIAHRAINEANYVSYEAQVYKKNIAYFSKIPFEIWRISGVVIPSRLDSGMVFISEKTADFYYKDARNFNENLRHYQTAGRFSIPGWHYLPDLDISFYHTKIYLQNISTVAYNSPLAPKSIRFYNFYPAGQYQEGPRTVYRIRLEPKKKYSPNFSGFMEIYGDSLYRLSSIAVSLGDRNMLEVVDSVDFEQVFYHTDTAYHQAMQKQLYHAFIVGFDGTYSVYNFFKKHRFFNPEEEALSCDAEVMVLEDSNIVHGTIWDSLRPVTLSKPERDILQTHPHPNRWIFQEQRGTAPIFEERPFRWYDFFVAGYDFDSARTTTKLSPLWYGLGYNTVEGTYLRYQLEHYRYYEDAEWYLQPSLRYGFSSRTFYYELQTSYLFNLDQPRKLGFHAGHGISQFNDEQPILPILNSLYTLFLSRNYMKLYGHDFVKASYDFEPVNGLEVSTSAELAHRFPLYNSTDFLIIGNPFSFTPNNPDFSPVINSTGFEEHQALNLHLSVVYQFNQLYKRVNGRKVNLSSTYPRVYFNYYKGVPTSFTKTNYDHLNLGITAQQHFGRVGLSKIDINAGSFLNRAHVPFVDFRHFNGIQTFFLQPAPRRTNSIRQFSTLPYYDFSTDQHYLELHFEHDFSGLLLGAAPLLAPLKLHAFMGLNYLNTAGRDQFTEFFLGVDNILNVMRVELAGGFDNFLKFTPSMRIGVDFDYRYYFDHRKKLRE